jgi:dienelactone hydrolase
VKRALAALTVLVCSTGAVVWITKPWVPDIVISDPGANGWRVNERGVFANYFPARDAIHGPAVLLLGGSEGGINGTGVARNLQAGGLSVLQAGYFGGPHQPKQLERVPLETFDHALAWLRNQPEVDAERVGVIGQSKGAEAALLVGTRDAKLRAVVASAGSSYAWPGINWNSFKADSSWTSQGKDLPVLPYGPFHLLSFLRGDIGRVYREGLPKRARHPEAAIRVERIAGPVLLVCGEDDTLWPSCPMSRMNKARAAAHGKTIEVLAYKHAGHHVFGPPTYLADPSLHRFGGTPAGNNAARTDAWPKVIAFLHTALA